MNILDVEVMKLESETYSFELYTDVIVEVLFKEKIENPKERERLIRRLTDIIENLIVNENI